MFVTQKLKNVFFFVAEEAAIDVLLKKTFGKEMKIESESDLIVKLNLGNIV